MVTALIAELREQLGDGQVLFDPLDLYVFGKDAGLTRGEPSLVVFPHSTEDVAAVMRAARRHGMPVIPRGSGTGLAGGAVATGPALLLVTTRMNRIEEVDPENRTAWVQPGVINLDLSVHTSPFGLYFAPDPSSQSACTVGGNVANNSGGLHCLAEGTTVNHVLAVEVVTPEGEVTVLGGAAPDPIGLDLRGVMVGSEGTLGIVTKVLVKLTPDPPAVRTLLMAFAELEQAAATVSGIIANGLVPGALEMMNQDMTIAVERFAKAGFPTDAGGGADRRGDRTPLGGGRRSGDSAADRRKPPGLPDPCGCRGVGTQAHLAGPEVRLRGGGPDEPRLPTFTTRWFPGPSWWKPSRRSTKWGSGTACS